MRALRHFYASVLLDAGESIKALSVYLGHSDPGFTLRTYTHLLPTRAANKAGRRPRPHGRCSNGRRPATAQERDCPAFLLARRPGRLDVVDVMLADPDPGRGPSNRC